MAPTTISTIRKGVLLVLLLVAATVVVFQYLPEEPAAERDSSQKTAPGNRPPAATPPVPSQSPSDQQRPSVSPEPDATPSQPVPPLNYEKPPSTVFVSRSISDSLESEWAESDTAPFVGGSVPRPLPEGPIPAKVARYARVLLSRYDTDGDGVLDREEFKKLSGNAAIIDYNADGTITHDELAAYLADYGRNRRMRLTGSMVEAAADATEWVPTAEQEARAAAHRAAESEPLLPISLAGEEDDLFAEEDDLLAEEDDELAASLQPAPNQEPVTQAGSRRFVAPKSRLAGLPDWFLGRDANGDGQLTLAEYAPNASPQRLAEFARFDLNRDGVLTAEEVRKVLSP